MMLPANAMERVESFIVHFSMRCSGSCHSVPGSLGSSREIPRVTGFTLLKRNRRADRLILLAERGWNPYGEGPVGTPGVRMATASSEVTGLLRLWSAGDESARDRLIPLVYDRLRA